MPSAAETCSRVSTGGSARTAIPLRDGMELSSRRFGGLCDAVADVGDGFDRCGFSEFASQSADRDVDGVGEGVDALVPYLGEQVFGAEDGVWGAHQGL